LKSARVDKHFVEAESRLCWAYDQGTPRLEAQSRCNRQRRPDWTYRHWRSGSDDGRPL